MDILLELHERARRLDRRIVLPEASDPRVREIYLGENFRLS